MADKYEDVCKEIVELVGGSGLFGVFNYVNPAGGMGDVVKHCIGVGIAGIITMVVTIAVYNDEEAKRCIR